MSLMERLERQKKMNMFLVFHSDEKSEETDEHIDEVEKGWFE